MTVRILLHGFIDSPTATRVAHDVVASTSGVELAGWITRPRFRSWMPDEWFGPRCRIYDEPFPPDAWQVPLDARPTFGLDEPGFDDNLRYLLDREQHFDNQYDVTLWASDQLLPDDAALSLRDQ